MKQKIRKLLTGAFGRYVVVGGSVYIFELVVIQVSQRFGASTLVAVALSFWLGLIVSFLLQKFFTFGDKRTKRKVLMSQIVAVTLLVLFNFGFTLLVTKILTPTIPATLSRTIALAITTLWNFYLYKARIFKEAVVD